MAKNRCEFSEKDKWRVEDLYKNNEDCEKELTHLSKEIKKFKKYIGKILESSNTLLELLELDTKVSQKLERAFIYAHINNDADTLDTYYQELLGKAQNAYTNYLEETSYIVPELLESDYDQVLEYIKENKDLNKYKRSLKHIYRNKKHILGKEAEKCLAAYAKVIDSADEIMGALTDSDFKFPNIIVEGKSVELTESNFSIYLRHADQKVRERAFKTIYGVYKDFKTTLAATMRQEIGKNVINAKLRNFKSSLEASLFSNEIDTLVYTNLIKSVHDNLEPLYKYFALKKNLLNIEDYHIYDTYADVSFKEKETYEFERAKELVLNAVLPLGEDYQRNIKKSFENGWIDICNNKGKRGGAYCTACYEVHPYVLLNYEKQLEDVSTLAHELGHAIHYYYACENQNFQDYSYSIFVAEVASQVNEILLCRYLLDNVSSNEEKMKIIDNLLQKYKSTIYRQTMFAEFELFMHEYAEKGGVLTSETLCDKYLELNKLYYGNDVIVDEDIKYEWERIPHFYMNFYVYQYATGFMASVKIANEIYNGNEEMRDNYLEFLKLGCTKDPVSSLKVAGVDITKIEVMADAISFMNELLDKYKMYMGSEVNE